MRRWTDGRRWGASRVGGGGFLVYTEYVFYKTLYPGVHPLTSTRPGRPNHSRLLLHKA